MELSRRGFMRAAAAAPVAAKGLAISVAEQARAVGLAVPLNERSGDSEAPRTIGEMDVTLFQKIGGLPDWKLQELWNSHKNCTRQLDPDIASYQSVSVAAKLRMQTRRNYCRAVDGFEGDLLRQQMRDMFLKKHNLHWF